MSEARKPHSEPDWTPAERVRQGIDSDSGEYGLQEDAHAALNGLLEQYESLKEHAPIFERDNQRLCDERDGLLEQLEDEMNANERVRDERDRLLEQLETCRGLLKQALDENIRLRVALEKIRDHRSPDGSQLISGRGAEAIASAALQTSGGAGMAVPSDLSRAPVAGATPPVSNPASEPDPFDVAHARGYREGVRNEQARQRAEQNQDTERP